MEVSNFTNPLVIVQTISILSYFDTLVDNLQIANSPEFDEKHGPIPVVNALCNYLEKHSNDQGKKLELVRELLRSSDLYGEDKNETPDIHFVNTLFDHIIGYPVFTDFYNKYGFLAEVARYSNLSWLQSQSLYSYHYLSNYEFENEYGSPSRLNECSSWMTFNNLIGTLFPTPTKFISSISVDYVYAQAGLMFFRSVWINPAGYSHTNTSDTARHHEDILSSKKLYDEYITVGLTIEHLVITGQLDESALKIFALPALSHYVHERSQRLQNESIEVIMEDPYHWANAYELLFSYLNDPLEEVKKARINDPRYQFQSALSNFKNLTTLAELIIEENCPSVAEDAIKDEIIKYVDDSKNYTCKDRFGLGLLPDINQLLKDQNELIAEKYYLFEMKTLSEAFSRKAHKELKNAKTMIVFRGRLYPPNHPSQGKVPLQLRPSDDVLLFHNPDSGQTSLYALTRNEYNVQLHKEADDPNLFKRVLGFKLEDELSFMTDSLPSRNESESSNDFIRNLAKERSELLREHLNSVGTREQIEELWKNFGNPELSLDEDNEHKAIDLRSSIHTFSNISSDRSVVKADDLGKVTKKYMFDDSKLDSFTFIDPSFELAHELGEEGLRLISKFVKKVGRRSGKSFEFTEQTLETVRNILKNPTKRIGKKFGADVHVKSLSSNNKSGYGYKFVYLPDGTIAELRTVLELDGELPVVLRRVTDENEEIYNQVDPKTRQTDDLDLHIKSNERMLEDVDFERFYEDLESIEVTDVCQPRRQKRSGESQVGSNLAGGTMALACRRAKASSEKQFALVSAAQWGMSYKAENPGLEILHELQKYVFPEDGRTELDFVKDWLIHSPITIPEWSDAFVIRQPATFNFLRYAHKLERVNLLTLSAAEKRLSFIDPAIIFDRHHKPHQILEKYKRLSVSRKIEFDVNFEDYFALSMFRRSALRQVVNSSKMRRMKMALYRSAIRGSDDPSDMLPKILYGREKMSHKAFRKIREGKIYVLNEFSSTESSSEDIAAYAKYGFRPTDQQVLTIFEMKFDDTYLRAKLPDDHRGTVVETVLLPGTEFHVDKILQNAQEINDLGIGSYVKIEMTCRPFTKYKWQQSVMREIDRLKRTGTRFYMKESRWHPSTNRNGQIESIVHQLNLP